MNKKKCVRCGRYYDDCGYVVEKVGKKTLLDVGVTGDAPRGMCVACASEFRLWFARIAPFTHTETS